MESHLTPQMLRSHVQGLSPVGRSLLRHVVDCPRCGDVFRQVVRSEKGEDVLGVLPWKLASGSADAPAIDTRSFAENGGAHASLMDGHLPGGVEQDPCGMLEQMDLEGIGLEEVILGKPGASTWRVIEAILQESRDRRHENARASERLALLAVQLTDRLDRGLYGERLIMDLTTRAWIYVAHARRAATHFPAAREACDRAWECLEKGTGDVLDRALMLECDGILSKVTWKFDQAISSLRRAEALFSLAGDDQAAGRLGVTLANLLNLDGQLEKSIVVLQAARQKIDPQADPILTLSIAHNLAVCLVDVGDTARAQELVDQHRELYPNYPELELRARWIQARIHRSNGEVELAEQQLISAQQGFVAMEVGYDAAGISLELATLYAEQGRFSEMRRLADEILPIFRSQDLHREALAALAIFQQAARMERVTLKLTQDLVDYLQKARHQPNLRFEGSD
jgi:tetratricopeptide (TPR) repeat protein